MHLVATFTKFPQLLLGEPPSTMHLNWANRTNAKILSNHLGKPHRMYQIYIETNESMMLIKRDCERWARCPNVIGEMRTTQCPGLKNTNINGDNGNPLRLLGNFGISIKTILFPMVFRRLDRVYARTWCKTSSAGLNCKVGQLEI